MPPGRPGKTLAVRGGSADGTGRALDSFQGGHTVVLIWVLVALLLLFAIVGGIAITKFLFLVLIVAALLALIGFFTRTA